jgi:cytochrome P450
MIILVIVGVVVLAWVVSIYLRHVQAKRLVEHIPGHTYLFPTPILDPTHHDNAFFNPWAQAENIKKYGYIYKIVFGGTPFVIVHRAENTRKLYQTKFKSSDKTDNLSLPAKFNWDSNNIFNSFRADWKRHRDLLNPGFSDNSLADIFQKNILPEVGEVLKVVDAQKHVNITNLFKFFTYDIISKAGFGHATNSLQSGHSKQLEDVEIMLRGAGAFLFVPEYLWGILRMIGVGPLATFYRGQVPWKEYLGKLVDEKMEEDSPDLLTRMKNALFDGDRLNRAELISNANVLLIAGHETTAATLIRSIYFIALNPNVKKKVQEEADSFKPVNNTWEEYSAHFEYLRCVMYETLRLRSPAHMNIRKIVEEVELEGKKVYPGTTVVSLEMFGSRDPGTWGTDAEEFKPERFIGKDIKRMDFFPFAVGPRSCIGKLMAEMEIIVLCRFR